MGKNLLVNML